MDSTASTNLSRCMGAVLETGQYADMKFLVHDGSEPLLTEQLTADCDEGCCLRAHCVVLAARCDWFRRALTSGMKESIERTIHVYDTDKECFEMFLKFIYTGDLETESTSLENLVELIALADRYEVDNLKVICEKAAGRHFKKDNIFEILNLADRFNAKNLKGDVLKFIPVNFSEKSIRQNNDFISLSTTLQKDLIKLYRVGFKRLYESSSDESDLDGEPYLSSPTDILRFQGLRLSDSESSEDEQFLSSNRNTLQEHFSVDKDALEECIRALRDVLSSDVSRGRLMEIALAADCDINRALNHYFS